MMYSCHKMLTTMPLVAGVVVLLSSLFLGIPMVVSAEQQTPFQPSSPRQSNHHSHNHHLSIPSIGLGLWNSKGDDAAHAVTYAFDAGYKHLDSAAAYGNEEYVGRSLSPSSKHSHSPPPPRHKYWVTSKLWNDAHRPSLVAAALDKTLSDLSIAYLDLYLMHWPVAFLPDQAPGRTVVDQDTTILDTWRAMEDLVRANKTRYVGVSNFSPRQLDQVLKHCDICPYAHEFETHPYLQQQDFVDWHADNNITVIAYSPLANMNPTYKDKYPKLDPLLEDDFWKGLASKKNCTVAQAVLAWGIQRGTVVIPKSVHEERIIENLGSLNVTFSKDEMREIQTQDKRSRFNNPSKGWGVELFEGLDDGSNRFLATKYDLR